MTATAGSGGSWGASGRGGGLATVRLMLGQFAETAVARLPLYRHLAVRAAGDDDVASLLLLAAPDDRNPTLLFAAIHDHLLAGAEGEPLAAWYPSIVADPRPVGDGWDDPWPAFRALALGEESVRDRIATRGTQTNEVGRCATTLPALGLVQRDVERPLGLIEVGASAGLNLRLDTYGYRWWADPGGSGDEIRRDADRDVVLESRWRGDRAVPVLDGLPTVGSRVGVDREPVDLGDPVAARWLVACQWPEQVDRLVRCRRAVDAARLDPPTVHRGDLVEEIGGLVADVPRDEHAVVLSTWVLAYVSVEDRRRFVAALDRAGEDRDLTLLVQEEPSVVPGLDLPPRPDGRTVARPTALCRFDWRAGTRQPPVRLADQHPHGTWAEWFVEP